MTLTPKWLRLLVLAAAAAAALHLAGCSTTKDEFAGRTAEKLYSEAKEDMDSGGYDRAIKGLERVEGLAAGTLLSQQAQLDLGYLYWKTGEKAQALSTIDRFIKLNPSSPALDYALFLRGAVNFNSDLGLLGALAGQDLSERDQRSARDAWQSFRQLVEQFPESRYSTEARQRMDIVVDMLASYEVHVARYYYNRGAYVAAANRAQQAVTEFQQAPAAEEALYILVQSYDRLQLTQLRDDADRILRQNFPASRYIAEGVGGRRTAWWRLW